MIKILHMGSLPSAWRLVGSKQRESGNSVVYNYHAYKSFICLEESIPFINANELPFYEAPKPVKISADITSYEIDCNVTAFKEQKPDIPILKSTTKEKDERLIFISIKNYENSEKSSNAHKLFLNVFVDKSKKTAQERHESKVSHFLFRMANEYSFVAFYSNRKHFLLTWKHGIVEIPYNSKPSEEVKKLIRKDKIKAFWSGFFSLGGKLTWGNAS